MSILTSDTILIRYTVCNLHMDLQHFVERYKQKLIEVIPLLIVLIIGIVVWSYVWDLAVTDYLDGGTWKSRAVWLGPGYNLGEYDIFGYTVYYQFEGYSDHSFFYRHWGYNILYGHLPYSGEFGYLRLDGVVNENGVYIFPPLTALLYGLGVLIDLNNCGIGFLIVLFGYITAFPVYGIAKHLSHNKYVGAVAALTYLLNPIVLYQTAYVWMNPAPFIFFFLSGFYMLIRGARHTGTLLIVVAALFKQTAWFLGLPLIVYLLLKERTTTEELLNPFKEIYRSLARTVDVKGFFFSVILVLAFGGAILLPFYLAQPVMLPFMELSAGGFLLDSFTDPPGYGSPMRLQVLPVVAGLPWLAEALEPWVYHGFLLWFGVATFTGIMFLIPKFREKNNTFFRRLLFLTMILLFWVHLTGPRGVYKYYFVVFAPFFSIFSSSKMIRAEEEKVPLSFGMFFLPIILSSLILIPPRNVYFFYVLLIFIGYIIASVIRRPRWLRLRRSSDKQTELTPQGDIESE